MTSFFFSVSTLVTPLFWDFSPLLWCCLFLCVKRLLVCLCHKNITKEFRLVSFSCVPELVLFLWESSLCFDAVCDP